jgi:fibronectin type 3 domain-containing protein
MKTLNSKIFFTAIVYFLLIFSTEIFSQDTGVYAVGGPKGIFINLSNEFNPSGKPGTVFKLSRIDKQGKKIEIAEIKTAATKTDFVSALTRFRSALTNSPVPDDKDIEKIWGKITTTQSLDSVALWGAYPLIKLSLGIMYLDSTATSGKEYKYTIEQIAGGESVKSESNFVSFPGKTEFNDIKVSGYKPNASNISIQWTTSSDNNPVNFIVYRQDNGKGNFNPAEVTKGFTRNDLNTSMFAEDNSVEANNFYKYFLIPLDLFENRGIASDSIFVGAYTFNNLPAIQNLSAVSVDSLAGIVLSWELPSPGAVVSVRIFRSEIFDSSFSQIAEVAPGQNNYLDLMVEPMKRYYYFLQQIGPLGEESPASARIASFFLSNEIPIPPVNITAVRLTNGVKLSWGNSESFIEGFRVYRSNGISDSLEQISDLITEEKLVTFFIDSSKELSGKLTYLYSVKSFTTSHIASDFSDTISIRPAIPTIPLTPTVLSGYVENNSALISWDDINEKDNSVLGYLVLRRIIDRNGKPVDDYSVINDSILFYNHNYFTDTEIEKHKRYEYSVISLDMFGGKSSFSNSIILDDMPDKPLPPAGMKVFNLKDGITIKWESSLQKDIVEYKIYRQTRKSTPEYLGSVKINEPLEITDRGIKKDQLYFYYITSVNQFDEESSPSKSVSVRL